MKTNIKKFLFGGFTLFSQYGMMQSDKARSEGCYSRSANYATAIRSFTKAIGETRLRNITRKTVAAYQAFMQQHGICKNTQSCYNRTLRAIYNKAVADGLVKDNHPFSGAFTGRAKTVKRSISEENIKLLKEVNLNGRQRLIEARDYFLFGFYAMGMPFIDIACLRKEQISGSCVLYNRQKTGQPVLLPLSDEAMAIIMKYMSKSSALVFPIITESNPEDAYRQYCTRLNAYNRSLKLIAAKAGITDNLTSYTVRHSWASIAYKSDVPLAVIAQALGHKTTDITMTYIREFDENILREGVNRVIMRIQ